MFESFDVSASGLRAQRAVLNVISQNIANSETTRDAAGKPNPYRRREVVVAPSDGRFEIPVGGVSVVEVREDTATDFRKVYDPGHPDAIRTGPEAGYVRYPNVEIMHEMVDMITATRAYEANVTAMDATKSIVESSFRILA